MNNLRIIYGITACMFLFLFVSTGQAYEPTFVYETFIPGYYLSSGHGIAVDNEGNSYAIGQAYADHVHLDVLVTKLGPDGSVLWITYIEGEGHDYAAGIALNEENDVYITGFTDSEDFPIVDGIDETLTGFRDAFVMKLSSQDGSILYSTYLGGDYVDAGYGITLNEAGEIYVVGSTKSTDFPTVDAYQDEPSAPLYVYSDAFITKFSATGDSILYSTYFGGYMNDVAENVALDRAGNIVFAGETNADDFPLVDPIVSNPNDIFISKLSADGSTLLFSTYFGGEDLDGLGGMVLDSDDYVYIGGYTQSVNFPTTPGAFQEEFAGEILGCGNPPFEPLHNCADVFVTKLGTDGSGLIYSTYLGGSEVEQCRDIALDSRGCAYVIGYTYSPDFPPDGVEPGVIFVSRFNPSGSELEFTAPIESGSSNAGHGITVDNVDAVYFTGAVHVPADVYVAKFIVVPDVTVSISSSMTQVPRYSNFIFDVEVTNNEADPQTLKGWTAAKRLPNGSIHEPLKGPVAFTLQPGETRAVSNIPQYIGNVPLGSYRYYIRIGEDFPEPLWNEDPWDFEVIP